VIVKIIRSSTNLVGISMEGVTLSVIN